jgi:predicted RNA binding protein YcfA (HicA-like mRNA interferase family)
VLAILRALGFSYKNSKGGHDHWKGTVKGKACKVTVSPKYAPFNEYLMQSMCKQANCTKQEFYGATPGTASKIR